jgi:ribosomal protein S18 acetylase RimI-like enzyme
MTLLKSLKSAGLMALHLEVGRENARAEKMYGRLGFERRPFNLMTWTAQSPI